jgi:pilus assembly protein CpaE
VTPVLKLVSSDAQLAQQLRETGLQCVVVARDALGTLSQPGARQPEVLVLDLRDQQQLPPAVAILKRQHPTTGILLVVAQLDPALMLEAMRAGVNEIVTHPVSVPELTSAVKRLMGTLTAGTRGEVYAFIGAKGGVGATTVAVNVATALATASSDSTLLVDLNVAFGDAAVFLGEEPRFSVMDALEHVQRLDEAFFRGLVVKTKSGLELLGASGKPVTGIFDATRIRALLDFTSHTRRITVLDVPRSDTAALDSLEMATRIVLVANQELATVRNASRMAATLRQRYGSERINLVLTRTDRRAEIGHEDIQRTVGISVRHTFPSDYRLALQAMNKGRPVVLDSSSELAAAFSAYARDLGGVRETEKESKAWSGGLFGRLSPRRV